MRHLPHCFALFLLTACELTGPRPVDVSTLPPMSGRELALMTTAQVHAQKGEYAMAEKNYLDAVAQSQGHVEAHLALADLYIAHRQPDKARAVLTRAQQFQPDHVAVNYLLGKLYLQNNQPREAVAAFDRALTTQPGSLDVLSARGIAHDMLRQHAAAQRDYQNAMRANPSGDLSMVRTNLAMSYLLDNKPANAAEILKEEVQADGTSPVTRHNLALAYGMLGRHTEAKALVEGDMSEEERQASLKRLAQYIAGYDSNGKALNGPTPVPVMETH